MSNVKRYIVAKLDHRDEKGFGVFLGSSSEVVLASDHEREVAALTDKLNNEMVAHDLTQKVLESLQNRWATRPVTDRLQAEVVALRADAERYRRALEAIAALTGGVPQSDQWIIGNLARAAVNQSSALEDK